MHQKRLYCGLFLLLIYGWMLLTFVTVGQKVLKKLALYEKTWNAEEAYPFEEKNLSEKRYIPLSIVRRVLDRIDYTEEMVDQMLKIKNLGYAKAVVLKRVWDRLIFRFNATTSVNVVQSEDDAVGDIVVRHENGEYAYLIDDRDISENLCKVSEFGQEMKEEGRNFLYFESPYKSGELDGSYYGVYKDYALEKIAEVLGTLRKEGLDVLSMTEIIEKEHMNRDMLFFRTDHHWLPQTGLWACSYLCGWLNENYGYSTDLSYFDKENYDVQSYEHPILGTQGRKATHIYCEPETLPIILPKYDSELEVFNSAYGKAITGTIEETLFDWDILSNADYYSEKEKYGVYGYGYEGLLQIHNKNKHDGKHVLLLKESFADCMTPWLSNAAEYVDVIDIRYFSGSKRTYIEHENPDTVILLCGVSGFINELDLD